MNEKRILSYKYMYLFIICNRTKSFMITLVCYLFISVIIFEL